MPEQSQPRSLRTTLLEAFAWAVGVAVLWGADTFTKFHVAAQNGLRVDSFRLITGQATSALAALIMIGFVVYWLRQFPLRADRWVPAVIGHTVGTAVFAVGHFCMQVAFRAVVFAAAGRPYVWREPFFSNLLVEYQKDIKIYLGIIVVASAYRYYRTASARSVGPSAGARKLAVQTGSGEAIVDYARISHLESSRNYVTVYGDGKEYLIRETITSLAQRLPATHFVRCHRSFIVNLDYIEEIKPVDGNHRIRLRGGTEVPLSRSYRDSLKEQIAEIAAN